jgi:predicted 3-demethylubiquinone-9 3-methyltransferase (glyoxalase superfamily)
LVLYPTQETNMKGMTTFLWFDGNGEEAAKFYCKVFKGGKITGRMKPPKGTPGATSKPLTVEFRINGMNFVALNGGPQFKFTEAVSFCINVETQKEVDYYWKKLTSGGGEESMCGWLKDKYGVSWQVTPTILIKLMKDKDPAKSARVMQAMLKMKKINIAALQKAAKG